MKTLWMGLAAVVAAGGLLGLAGCDLQKIAELEEGVSTEADVRTRFGEPAAVYDEGQGAKTLEYPRQPAGQKNYMITIGADGKMSALRQVLKPSTFKEIKPGMTGPQVRRLLGQPATRKPYALKQEEVWEWRFLEGQESKLFSVTFDAQQRVSDTATSLDEASRS